MWTKLLVLGIVCFQEVLANNPRIINGTEAAASDTRHQVSIRSKLADAFSFGAGHQCGGSVIAPTVVLTAAHCFFDENTNTFRHAYDFKVVMGTLDRRNKSNAVQFDITHYSVMSTFNMSTYQDDIAVVFLDGTIPSNLTSVEAIQLEKSPIAAGTICSVTGWGTTGSNSLSRLLMSVDVPLVDRQTCATNYGDQLMDGMVCAGLMEGGKDSCLGDSGGPLVCGGKLAGVVSWGEGCAEVGYPGVYTDVSYYYDWIKKEARGNGGRRNVGVSGFLLVVVFMLLN